MKKIPLFVLYLSQDDPKKCTAKKMERFGLVKLSTKTYPKKSIILDPNSYKILGYEDLETAILYGITAVDGTWEKIDKIFTNVKGESRRLPFLVPGNPTNFGHPGKLSTAEAFTAALFILGFEEQAVEIMNKFSWGHTFLEMNMDLLRAYERKGRDEIEKIEKEFINFK